MKEEDGKEKVVNMAKERNLRSIPKETILYLFSKGRLEYGKNKI